MAGYATIWEFIVTAPQQAEFERHYAADGSWAQLFRKAHGYIGTELLQDRSDPQRYLTVDRWTDIEAYRDFRRAFAEQYTALDRQCENLSTRETALGEFAAAGPAH